MNCENCGKQVPKGYLICPSCHHKTGSTPASSAPAVAVAPSSPGPSSPSTNVVAQSTPLSQTQTSYAGFWIRFAAHLVDQIILLAIYFSLLLFFSIVTQQDGSPIALAFYAVITLFYEAYFTTRMWFATPGKRALKLQVFDEAIQPMSFGVAMGRSLLKFVSGITFGIGYLMIAFTSKKQGLHDLMVRTVVIRS